jgi:hypothetical protein
MHQNNPLKGQSHEKVTYLRQWDVFACLLLVFKFLFYRPFNSYDSLKFNFCLIKHTSHLDWLCSSADSNLASCKESCVYRTFIAGYLESWAPTLLASGTLIHSWDWCRGLAYSKHWNTVRQSLDTGGFLLVVAMKAIYYYIGPMSADQHQQLGIRRGARRV